MHFVKKRKNKSASYMWSNCTKTLIFNVEEFTFWFIYLQKKRNFFFLMLWICFQWKHLWYATLLLRNSRVTDMTEGELEFVPWAWPFNCGETEFRMTTVLKKVLQDHVMFHSFQMTNMPISQVFRRGTGRRVFEGAASMRGIRLLWVWAFGFVGWVQGRYARVRHSYRKCLKVTNSGDYQSLLTPCHL